jgi:hypothetical protein
MPCCDAWLDRSIEAGGSAGEMLQLTESIEFAGRRWLLRIEQPLIDANRDGGY